MKLQLGNCLSFLSHQVELEKLQLPENEAFQNSDRSALLREKGKKKIYSAVILTPSITGLDQSHLKKQKLPSFPGSFPQFISLPWKK